MPLSSSVDYPYDYEANRGSILPEDSEEYAELVYGRQESEDKAEAEVGFIGGITHSAIGTWARMAISRESPVDAYDRYVPTREEQEEILKAFDYDIEPAKAVVNNLATKEDIPKAIEIIKENLEYAGYEAKAPLLDTLASGFGDAVVDPINLATGALTGGLGYVGRVGLGAAANVVSGQLREGYTGVETNMMMDALAGLALGGFFEGVAPVSKYLKDTYLESMAVQSHLVAGEGLTSEFFNNNFVGKRLKVASSVMTDFIAGKLTPLTLRGNLDGIKDTGALHDMMFVKGFKTEAGVKTNGANGKPLYKTYSSAETTAEEIYRNGEDLIEHFELDRIEPTKRIYARGFTDDEINEGLLSFLGGKELELPEKYKESLGDFKMIADDIRRGMELANNRNIQRGAYKQGAFDWKHFFPRVWDRNKIADFLLGFGTSSISAAKKMMRERVKRALIEGLEADQVYNQKMFEAFIADRYPKSESTSVALASDSRRTVSGSTDVSKDKSLHRPQDLDISSPEYKKWVEQKADEMALGITDQGEGLRRQTYDQLRPEMPLNPHDRLPWNTAHKGADGFCLDDYRASVIDTYKSYMRRNTGDWIAYKVYGAKDFQELDAQFKKAVDAEVDVNRGVDRARLEKSVQLFERRLYGMGLRDYDAELGFGDAVSEILRNLTFATANTYMGILNYTEMSAAVLAHGPMMLLKSIPGIGKMFSRISKGGMTSEDEELLLSIAFTREPSIKNIWGDVRRLNRYRYGKHKVLADIVAGTQYASNALPTTKFLVASQQNIVDTARGAMLRELILESKGLRKTKGGFLRAETRERLSISEANYKKLMDKLNDTFEVDSKGRVTFKYKTRGALTLADDYDTLMTLRRLGDFAADETILRNHLADTFNWDNRSSPLISLLAQFKSFALRSYSKRLVKMGHRIAEGDYLYQGANFSISLALAALGNLGITYTRTAGMSEDDREKYWEMALGITPDMNAEEFFENAIAASALRSSVLAAPALFLNALGVGTLNKTTSDAGSLYWSDDEDDVKLFGKINIGDALVQMTPALRTAGNYFNLSTDLMNFLRVSWNSDDFTYEQEQRNLNSLWKSIKRVTPQWSYMTNAPLDFLKEEITDLE